MASGVAVLRGYLLVRGVDAGNRTLATLLSAGLDDEETASLWPNNNSR